MLIFILGLFAISQGVELVYDEKPIDKDFFIKQLSLYKNKILDFVGKKYPSSLENIKSLFENGSNYNSFNLKNYFEKLENETPFFILSNLSDKQLLSFLYLFHFVTKPLEKISCEDIKSLARDFCQIEKNDFERNINNNFLLKNENLNILRAKSNYVEFFFRLGKEKNLNLPQFYFEKLYFKFTLLKICAIEKIYKYISLNLSEYKEIENILEKTILKENFKKQVSFNKGKVVLKSFWKEYLECLENIFPCVEKSFYFNNFFRMQLFYRKGILEKLSDIENNSKKGENFYKKLDTSKGNFKKLKYSEREIGNDNYKRIISYYESILSSEKQDKTTEEIEKIKK